MIEYISWDSDFFGWKTGKINLNLCQEIESLLLQGKEMGYKLLYVYCPQDFYIDKNITDQYDGILVDRKVLYKMELPVIMKDYSDKIDEFSNRIVNSSLINLAWESGKYSRFNVDKHFHNDEFKRMYSEWIEKSVTKKIADYVFVSKNNIDESIKSFITLKINNDTAHIGLIAVDSKFQGNGYGRLLINHCISTAIKNKCQYLETITQYENNIACKFYEACGFRVESIKNIYHFWL